MDEPRRTGSPIVSTVGFAGEGELRRLRRLSVADVLARHLSQNLGRSATLLDVAAVDAADESTRTQLVPRAVEALGRLPENRLAVLGDRLVLVGDDLLKSVVDSGNQPRWPESVLAAHRVAVGGSRGAMARFVRTDGGGDIEVFTTRPDTILGASFVAVSPSHPAARLATPEQLAAFRAECDKSAADPEAKIGVPLGISVQNPLAPDRELPVWLANFVVDTYGTGAAGGCPACDQRDLDFARRYRLDVFSIVCPPHEDPATYQVGDTSHPGDGTIINSGFLNGLPVPEAIDAAIARLAEVGRGKPTVQYRRRPLVVAEAAGDDGGDVRRFDRSWRFTEPFLTAAGLVAPAGSTEVRPHRLHVTTPELANKHLLDTRVLTRALDGGRGLVAEPWDEVVLVGDVLDPYGEHGDASPWESDAFRLAVLADTPPDRDLEWSDKRYQAAVKFVESAERLFRPPGGGEIDRDALAGRVAKAAAALENALSRRRTNTAVAAVREIISGATDPQSTGLDESAQAFAAALLYAMLPGLAAKGFAAAGSAPLTPPAWPEAATRGSAPELIELAVQINGKRRGTVQVPSDATEEAALAAIRADESLWAHVGDKEPRKVVVVRNRLVNIVV